MAVRMFIFNIVSVVTFCFLVICTSAAIVENLNDGQLNEIIASNEFVLALLYADPCDTDDCKTALGELPLIAKATYVPNIRVVQVANSMLVTRFHIGAAPKLLYFRRSVPILYDVKLVERDDVVIWLENNKESSIRQLDSSNFEHLTQASTGATTGDWFILFYGASCLQLAPVWEAVSSRLRHKLNVATVDIDANTDLRKRFKISRCPSAIFFRLGSMYRYELNVHDVKAFVSFAEGWYSNSAVQPVPSIPTPFDVFTDEVVAWLKVYVTRDFLIVGVIVLSLITLVLAYFIYRLYTDETFAANKPLMKRD